MRRIAPRMIWRTIPSRRGARARRIAPTMLLHVGRRGPDGAPSRPKPRECAYGFSFPEEGSAHLPSLCVGASYASGGRTIVNMIAHSWQRSGMFVAHYPIPCHPVNVVISLPA